MVRETAGYDYDAALRIVRWPIEELLVAFIARARDEARANFRQQSQRWATLAPWLEKKHQRPPQPSAWSKIDPNTRVQ